MHSLPSYQTYTSISNCSLLPRGCEMLWLKFIWVDFFLWRRAITILGLTQLEQLNSTLIRGGFLHKKQGAKCRRKQTVDGSVRTSELWISAWGIYIYIFRLISTKEKGIYIYIYIAEIPTAHIYVISCCSFPNFYDQQRRGPVDVDWHHRNVGGCWRQQSQGDSLERHLQLLGKHANLLVFSICRKWHKEDGNRRAVERWINQNRTIQRAGETSKKGTHQRLVLGG